MQINRSPLYSLFTDFHLRDLVFQFSDLKDASHVMQASQELNVKMKEANGQMTFRKLAHKKLVQAVLDADWIVIQKILAKHPDLMFEKFTTTTLGKTFTTCVVDFASYVRDMYTLQICLTYLRKVDRELFKEIVRAREQRLYGYTFWNDLFDDDYHHFQEMFSRWLSDDKKDPVSIDDLQSNLVKYEVKQSDNGYSIRPLIWIHHAIRYMNYTVDTVKKMEEFMMKIDGFVKRYLMPAHMIKQMLAVTKNYRLDAPEYGSNIGYKFRWHRNSKFNDPDFPLDYAAETLMPGKPWEWHTRVGKFVSEKADDVKGILGNDYTFISGSSRYGAIRAGKMGTCDQQKYIMNKYEEDYEVFLHLNTVRNEWMTNLCDHAYMLPREDDMEYLREKLRY